MKQYRVWSYANAQQSLIRTVVTNMIELEVAANVFSSSFYLKRDAFDSSIPRVLTTTGSLPFHTYLPTRLLHEILPDIANMCIAKRFDLA